MPYTAEISRANPSCFLFLIDQSGSMADPFGDSGRSKADEVATAINRLLQTLVLRCAKSAGVRDYYHVGVIGYGSSRIAPALAGPLFGRSLVPVSDLANHPLRVEQRTRQVPDGAGGLVAQPVKFPVWFEPVADGSTPMCETLDLARVVLRDFLGLYPRCYPPVAINITDGEATDGDPEPAAARLRDLASTDGNALLFNAHLSSRTERPVEFPDLEADLPDEFARLLFRLSSPLPPPLRDTARREGFRVSEGTRGFVFNADLVSVIRFLDIGTRIGGPNLR
jgi:hypothetical protein